MEFTEALGVIASAIAIWEFVRPYLSSDGVKVRPQHIKKT